MTSKKAPAAQAADSGGKAMQALLTAALEPDNFEPFLKKLAAILAAPGALGARASIAILFDQARAPGLPAVFRGFPSAEQRRLLSSGPAARRPLGFLSAEIRRVGRLLARPSSKCRQAHARGLIETAAGIITARVSNEKRDAELNFEKDLASSVKHIEELYLSFPGISLREISRAVLDEARRLTGSTLGLAGHIDQETGWLVAPAATEGPWASGAIPGETLILKAPAGLWGRVLKARKAVLVNGAAAGHVFPDRQGSFLGVPAAAGRRLLGMLALARPAGAYGQKELRAVQKLALVYGMILQRQAAEDRRKEEDTRFHTIVSSSRDVIYTVSLDGRISYVSPRAEDYGYAPAELVGRLVMEFAHPEDRDFLTKALANAVNTGRTLPILPYRLRRKDGTYAYVAQKSGIVFKEGKPSYITGVLRDVTEQRQTELRLRESEALLSMVFDTAKDAIFVKDMNGMYVKANRACAALFNLPPGKLLGKTDDEIFPEDILAEVRKEDYRVAVLGETLSLTRTRALPSGVAHLSTIKTPLRDRSGKIVGLLGIARDISDLKKMESELALARAAEAVSSVARPMAHDFNNALAAINGYATLIDDDLDASSPIKKEISRILEAVQRAAELTSKFQDFARNPKIKNPGEAGDKQDGH